MAKRDVASVDLFLELLRVSKNLERIGDLSTNIAEDVIFIYKRSTSGIIISYRPYLKCQFYDGGLSWILLSQKTADEDTWGAADITDVLKELTDIRAKMIAAAPMSGASWGRQPK